MNDETQPQGVHIIVHGRVQAVGFRYFTSHTANSLGVVGWVRNRADGTVEIEAEGMKYKLEQLLDMIHKGPPHAWVERLETQWRAFEGKYGSFYVR